MLVTPPVSLVIEVSRIRVMIEYPSLSSALVSTRLGIAAPRKLTDGSDTAVPSWPVRVMADSHSDGGVVISPVDGYVCDSAQESAFSSDEPLSACVVIEVSWYLPQNVGDTTLHAAPEAQVRSVGTSVREVPVVNVTCAAGVTPYTAPARSPYSI